jgi:hypothetical protein
VFFAVSIDFPSPGPTYHCPTGLIKMPLTSMRQ